ncbi:unnamed protein product (macronuclear) [Paramecium tetraurelia]|uniref:Uncharacterized protein n=1 Tax=Paramecium tetraurelia TaxID=5888 RepID=A0BUU5_PARTE|nr:uncharacterized protein GSPATT00005558001 [Paramecium tetraurelia]CAK62312.1 unnamed protein product [Paramecium tetraurelia]|eukprot:XP_001429710.1 hypothetical protein (macronuclear) [Paramecium tetraurelia strain d4-2]
MDQEIVDQLTLDSIPYYEEQLYGALQVIIDLQQKVEQQEMILDDDNSNENQAEDVEADLQEIISTIQFQQLKELQDIDEISQKQQEDFDQLFKQLHELEQMTNQYQQENNQDEQHIKITQQMIFERQQQLKELSQQFMMQDIHNQENQRVIQNLQQKLQLDTIIMPQHGSNEQTIEVNQIVKHQRQESEEDVDYIQYLQLTDYKQKLEEELEQIANQPKVLKEMIEVSTQTHEQEFAIRKNKYDDFAYSISCVQPTYSLENTPKTSQILLHSLLKEEKQKNRGCCSDCRIY